MFVKATTGKDGLLFKWVDEEGFYYKIGEKVGKFRNPINVSTRSSR